MILLPRPVPDAPWGVLIEMLTGRRSKIIHAHTPTPSHKDCRNSRDVVDDRHHLDLAEKKAPEPFAVEVGAPELDLTAEKESAYRALRVASWQIVFYLITTDILGFSSSPAAFW